MGTTRSSSAHRTSVGAVIRCRRRSSLGLLRYGRPAVARQAGQVAVGGEDEVDVGLLREHAGAGRRVVEERRHHLVGRHQEDVRGHVARDPQPGGAQQRQPLDPLGRVDGELGRQPAAQRAADDVHALEAEAVEDVEVVVDEVVHRLDLGHVVGAAEARMVGRHHVEAAGAGARGRGATRRRRRPRGGRAAVDRRRRAGRGSSRCPARAVRWRPRAARWPCRSPGKRIAHSCSLCEQGAKCGCQVP